MEEKPLEKKPNIYEYNNYRAYLLDFYRFHKEKSTHGFSFRIFSKRARLRSPNYLQLIMEGRRNLSSKMIPRFAEALKLENRQKEFFGNLVKFTQAETASEKDLYFKALLRFREYRETTRIRTEQYAYFSNWYYVAIREMVALKDFQEDPKVIAASLYPPVTEEQVKEAIRVLLQIGLLVRDERGKLKHSETHLTTDEAVKTISVYKFHQQMISRGLEALNYPEEERFISSITLPLPRQQFPFIKTKVFQFLKEIQSWSAALERASEEIYQLNFQLFGLTKMKTVKEEK
ncbi:MAG: TIGR02147 family protein [Deltaproteobacteria bacterium]|nr:TIGR02147 family protein [Deltaproteobacteria bacterium]